MLFSALNKVREKVTDTRTAFASDDEKPFLDHLEDLRTMLMRIVITLLVAMLGCFIFHKQLLEITYKPAKAAGLIEGEPFALPEAIAQPEWSKAEKIAEAAALVDPAYRNHFLDAVTGEKPELRALVEAYAIFTAASSVDPGEPRQKFVSETVNSREEISKFVNILLTDNPNADPKGTRSKIKLIALRPSEGFMISLKISLFAGIALSFPFLLFFIAEFVLPGLHKKEKKLLAPALAVGFGLFAVGAIFCYTVVAPRALEFFQSYSENLNLENTWTIGEYVSFVTLLVLLFGLCFELPVVVLALVKLELLSFKQMNGSRSYAIVAIYFIAALITPTVDLITLNLLAIPMLLLYEISIWLAYFLEKSDRKKEEAERAERLRKYASGETATGASAALFSEAPEEHEEDHEQYHDEEEDFGNDEYHDSEGRWIGPPSDDEGEDNFDDDDDEPGDDVPFYDEDGSRDPDSGNKTES